ncbi:MAG: GNAT family N-acetyltransferase [Gemmatimonadaceae bacterium]|nr:GNAT family N-acetyltransferase [Gemmatimonadaceae bacterium]
MSTSRIRSATADDRQAIAQLLGSLDLPTDDLDKLFDRDPSQFLVAEDMSESASLSGVVGIEECCEHALLRSVAVRPDMQQQGLGHRLVEHAVAQAEARGVAALYLLTMTAELYFPRFGFERVARDVVPSDIATTAEFTHACPASAVVMRRSITTPLA